MSETAVRPSAASQSEEVTAWRDATLQLAHAAVDSAVSCGNREAESFREFTHDSLAQMQAAGPSQVLATAGILSQAIAHHGDKTQRQVDSMLAGVDATLQLFLRHFERLHGEAESRLVADLRADIESALRQGSWEQMCETSRVRLEELARRTEEKRQRSVELTAGGTESGPVPAGSKLTDPGTGLPLRASAEEALRRAIDRKPQAYAVAFYLHRMQLTNARFGDAIGNQVILFCSQHIAAGLVGPKDALFRWAGPAFVAIIERPDAHLTLSSEVQRWISLPLNRFFETPARSVYLPIKVTAAVIPLFDTQVEEVLESVDRFLLTTSGQLTAAD